MALIYIAVSVLFAILTQCSPTVLPTQKSYRDKYIVTALIYTNEGKMNHSYWFRRLFDTQLTLQESACAQNATVFHAESGSCAWLFEQGPCATRQWLVLDRGGSGSGGGLRPVCRRRPCAPGYGFLADEPRCAPQEDLCKGSGRVFRYSLRGEGRCHCNGFRAQGPDGQCHALFTQGPCQKGQVLAPAYDRLDSHLGACVRAPCAEGSVRIEEEEDGGTAQCHSLDALDCSLVRQPLFDLLVGLDVPVCDYSKRNTIKIPTRPQSCVRDNRGICTTYFVHSEQPFAWGVSTDEDAVGLRGKRADSFLKRFLFDYDLFDFLTI